MKFISTRLSAPVLSFEEVVLQGLANDGGLYVPEFLPQFDTKKISDMKKMDYEELFFEITRHFIDSEIDEKTYREIIKKSYRNFSHSAIAPTKQLSYNHFLLELFHGPTLAFKDFALQFLGNLLDHFLQKRGEKIVIIGATSGDTGSAAIQGCMHCKNAQIFILHPKNKVSDVQRRQMTTVIVGNVFNIALEGNFDDCQAMVKKMFADQSFLHGKRAVAVNSINFARILAQIVYYFYVGARLGADEKHPLSFAVPSGNFGDIYAGFLAKKMGLSVNKLIIATNANDILVRFLNANDYRKENMIETISPSMNIQVSSNFERLLFDYHKSPKLAQLMREFEESGSLKVSDEILRNIQKDFAAFSCDDETTKKIIKEFFDKTGETLDPHSAIGVYAADEFIKSEDYRDELVVSLATAHPAKFPNAVIDAGAPKPQLPHFLKGLMKRKEKFVAIENDLDEVKKFIAERL
ncbi:MAG: threonine synthase [Alphaproteobacteria bacterium RIFCSPLOWO2_01_FULL_40_26]|nr:MAG: threonine synthase [Alphaproteobacteria bacterium RIFCSPHIGHO2_02_FULL_40_34]OFW88225.1 MAG: threonine synthase [Alphaproteobacteria bacterium RIFCSPHIGHO2_01_FULL_40_8]OFW94397.1 MAG: threonine synthase [Alphaproteobacteria bacterium RIFCSPLOWO2_01_FULL_40_26]OFX09455.1 MAG: threonine synthase [Alphaproteobacteria bacterium RIFCSPLOWO2_02_FULL_40_19]OFX11631.1 MAG: threonine synthase [Alphaproteobacteria bacterium RIFCSPLOWO2_12_FULL_40_11]